jgi:hypothetical protein
MSGDNEPNHKNQQSTQVAFRLRIKLGISYIESRSSSHSTEIFSRILHVSSIPFSMVETEYEAFSPRTNFSTLRSF